MKGDNIVVRVLTSAMGLGTYVPALFLKDFFLNKGIQCELQLIETYLCPEKIEKFLQNKEHYHKSFKVAKLGHKLAEKQLSELLDENEKKQIFEEWDSCACDLFIVMSGNWMDTLLEYVNMGKTNSNSICTIHMDVGSTPSWCRFMDKNIGWNISIYDEDKVGYMFEYPKKYLKKVSVFENLANSCVYIHGGGWGMGTYQERYKGFGDSLPSRIKTTIHSADEANLTNGWEYYLLDKKWMPWELHTEDLYPPIGRVTSGGVCSIPNSLHGGMYSLYEDCCAIISKAGGGTLMDSLITATPLVFIEPIATHEKKNQELWIKLHLGITYEDWEKQSFSISVLDKIYQNLIEYREKLPGLGEYLLSGIKKGDSYV